MTGKSSSLQLNNGVKIPAIGLGVFQSKPEETAAAVKTAIANGYRLIDTAAAYQNERQVGEGIRQSEIDRKELFITTKLWLTDNGYDSTLKAFEVSLRKLGLNYLDLYLLHWPVPTDFEKTIAAYEAAEKLLADGRVRAIGVCNFIPKHLEQLLIQTEIVPAVNQIELNPFFTQQEARDANAAHGILTEAWSPIGGTYVRKPETAPNTAKSPLEHPVVTKLAEKYGKTPAQVVLRWHVDHGILAIPKSVKQERIAENIDVFDFALTTDELAAIDGLDTGKRAGGDPEKFTADTYPIKIEE